MATVGPPRTILPPTFLVMIVGPKLSSYILALSGVGYEGRQEIQGRILDHNFQNGWSSWTRSVC